MSDKTEKTEKIEAAAEEIKAEASRFPKLDLHKLPGADSVAEVVEAQLTHLKGLLEEWAKFETEQKERILHGIDELARWAHQAVDFSTDLTAKARKTSIDWIDHGSERLHKRGPKPSPRRLRPSPTLGH